MNGHQISAGAAHTTAQVAKVVAVEDLSGNDIGKDISFDWRISISKLPVNVKGELRQVYHVGGQTTLSIIGEDEDGPGEIDEFSFAPNEGVHVYG